MKRSYDAVANSYDGLAKLFIGAALRNSQIYLLQYISGGAKVLIAGGGTGWILEEITKIHPQGLSIDYIDISAKMIAKSKKRICGKNHVRFIQQSILNFDETNKYDVIITPFFLDNFLDENMQRVFALLHKNLCKNGLWLYADFQVAEKQKIIQKFVLFVMYAFFRMVCGIEAKKLPDVAGCFASYQYQLINTRTFKSDFIIAAVYKKIKQ